MHSLTEKVLHWNIMLNILQILLYGKLKNNMGMNIFNISTFGQNLYLNKIYLSKTTHNNIKKNGYI